MAGGGPGDSRVLSLWLVPPEPALTAIRQQVDNVAKEQNLPPFEPHITIIGNVGSR